MENLIESEMEKLLPNYPSYYREKIDVQALIKKVMDPVFTEIICTLHRTQQDLEDLISMRNQNLISKHAREIQDITKTRKKNLMKVMQSQQAEVAANIVEIFSEVDRMVSFQHGMMVKMRIPGFFKTDSEDEENLQQKLFNEIYELVVMAKKLKNDKPSLK